MCFRICLSLYCLVFSCLLSLQAQSEAQQALLNSLADKENYQEDILRLIGDCGENISCHDQQLIWIRRQQIDFIVPHYYNRLGEHLRRKGAHAEAEQALLAGLASCGKEDQQIRGYLLNSLSVLHWRYYGQLDSGTVYAFLALEEFGEDYAFDQHQPYMQLGQIKEQMVRWEDAMLHYQQAFERAELLPENRFAYGYSLFHLLGAALQLEDSGTFARYIGRYQEFLNGAVSIDSRHDAMLNFLVNDAEAVASLERILADPAFQANDKQAVGAAAGSLEFSHRIVAQALMETGRYAESEEHLRKSLAILEEAGVYTFQPPAYQMLADIGRLNNDPDLLIEGLENYNRLQDSLNKASFQEQISQWEVRYETERTEADLVRSELAVVEARRQRDSLLLGSGLLASLALGIFLLLQARLRLTRRKADFAQQLQEQEINQLKRDNELTALRSMIEGQEAERSRVAKDLHDGLGGLLTTIKAQLSRVNADQEATMMVDRASVEVRRIAHNLMPKQLTQAGLAGALKDLCAQLRVQGLAVELELSEQLDDYLDDSQRHAMLRIAQELCQNVTKHANAQSIFIQALASEKGLLLIVEDDGRGFNQVAARELGRGMGLSSIENRVAFLRAEILYDSQTGQGTTVTINVPL